MRKLLWVGDAACSSGFGRASHFILNEMQSDWNIEVLGVNYRGDPHKNPYDIYPCWPGGDQIGLGRLKERITARRPDLIVLQTNPWYVPQYQKRLHHDGFGDIPVAAIIAVEGNNCRGIQLNGLKKAIFWTRFAQREAVRGGLTIPSAVIPLGVDTEYYTPGDKQEARDMIGLPEDQVPTGSFIIGNINRNQTRKKLDLSVIYFAKWIKANKIANAYLYFHTMKGSSQQVHLEQLAQYYGVEDRLILAEPKDIFQGAPEEYVRASYRSFDLSLSTALGEGWGLTAMEAMACGIMQIAGDYAALGEWGRDAVYLVDVDPEEVMPDVNNMLGARPNEAATIAAIDLAYRVPDLRKQWGAAGLARVREPQFRWSNIAQRFAEAFREVC